MIFTENRLFLTSFRTSHDVEGGDNKLINNKLCHLEVEYVPQLLTGGYTIFAPSNFYYEFIKMLRIL